MLQLLDKAIYLLVYLGFLIGGWLLLFPLLSPYLNRRKVFRRFRVYTKQQNVEARKSKVIRHIRMLLAVTFNTKSTYAVLTFFVVSGLLFSLSLLFLMKTGNNLYFNLLVAAIAGLIPYLILQIKLHNIRISSSYEAESLISELMNQYKVNYLNMIEAIDQTIPRLKRAPYSKMALFRFSLGVKQYGNKEELEELIQEFHFSINTSWSLLLATNLFLSIELGDDVRPAVDDILEDLIDLQQIQAKNQQYNHESFFMIKYLSPGTYLLSVYAMFSIFGFTWDKFIEYQFKNPLGFRLFMFTVLFLAVNYLIYFFIKKPKNDF